MACADSLCQAVPAFAALQHRETANRRRLDIGDKAERAKIVSTCLAMLFLPSFVVMVQNFEE